MVTARELPIDDRASATEMAQEIFGDGVTVVSARYYGDRDSSGIYTDGDRISPGVTPGDRGVILSTGDTSGFTNSYWNANWSSQTTTNSSGQNNNADFNAAAGAPTYDAAYIEAEFIPDGDVMTMQFVFASEEYPEYAVGAFQDFVGVWINDQFVEASVGDGDVDPNNINAGANENLFIDNTNSAYNTEMDGFTVTLTLKIPVNAGEVNSIRIGIADVNDSNYDSALLIAGGSIQTTLVAQDDEFWMDADGSKIIDVTANDIAPSGGTLTITHINGQPVSAGSILRLPNGQLVQLRNDGTIEVIGDGDEEVASFTYTVTDGLGHEDTGLVHVNTVPCFVTGTLIATPEGERRVEALQPGDLVYTKDNGPQPLRWIGTRQVAAEGSFAPIRIAADTFGAHRELLVSPLHRILIRDSLAEILFGEAEVLVAAKDLVNDRSVRRVEGGMVEYVHIMFDQHEVVFSEGLATESFLPGPQTTECFERETLAEICALFPELDPETGKGYSPAARRTLKHFEAQVLLRDGTRG